MMADLGSTQGTVVLRRACRLRERFEAADHHGTSLRM